MTEMRHGSDAVDTSGFESPEVTGWIGWIIFAGTLMLIDGFFSIIAGLVALFRDDYYLVGPEGLVVDIDYTAWGWIHLAIGLVVVATGAGAIAGQTWARVVGVVVVTISAVVNFAFLTAHPFWTTIVIALDIFVIYALVVHGREIREF
ncbi:DUF7144 family membrane protein [Kribbella sp. CA-247076]|uniref:DUF7144 family membrane protein n=1 Tax=Kribbella sp. CA-247076 TaxID=3239941 RepID=UPI003D90667B